MRKKKLQFCSILRITFQEVIEKNCLYILFVCFPEITFERKTREKWKIKQIIVKSGFSSITTMGKYFTPQSSANTLYNLYPCDICDNVFPSKSSLKRHKMLFHQFVQCLRCHSIFTYHDYLSKHENNMFCSLQTTTTRQSTEESAEYHCPICSKIFLKLISLKKHVEKHTNGNPVRCTFCGRFYLDSNLLIRHIQIRHSTKKKFHECDMCSKVYKCRHKFQKHKIEHNYELVYPYDCKYCGKKCGDIKGFKKHLKSNHGTRIIIRNMTCHVCHQPCPMKYHLETSHIYICRYCQHKMKGPLKNKGMWRFTISSVYLNNNVAFLIHLQLHSWGIRFNWCSSVRQKCIKFFVALI